MNVHDTHPNAGEAAERVAALCTAILRIGASLDPDTVLRAAVDGARDLTGARLGMIATVDETGAPDGFVESGFTLEETAELAAWPDRGPLFEHLRSLEKTLRVDDLAAYVRGLGLVPTPALSRTFQGTPMLHRGVNVGSFFLAEKPAGTPFTDADEALLALFASQAATAIANARTHRAERRARARVEALVETSPVGVVVFDVHSGLPASFNREARRIVAGLLEPDAPPESVLKELTCRFADGAEVALDGVRLARTLGDATTLRAEEVELSIADGRCVRTLINVTPIRNEDGGVLSVVVTLQDLGPLEELERLRAEFLTMVSHELRAPLTSIKGSAAAALGARPPLPRTELLQFLRIVDAQADHMRGLIGNLLDAGRIEAGTLSVDPKPTDVAMLVDRARNTFASGGAANPVGIDLPPDLPRVMADGERVEQVLYNLLTNAARNSPGSSPIRVQAARDGVHVAVSVVDQGRGLVPKTLRRLFQKHVALGDKGGGIGPTGLGLTICKGLIEAHGGRIRAESAGIGHGARFTFTLPIAETGLAARTAHTPEAARPTAAPDQLRVLVVDDDPNMLRFVRNALTEAGYEPLTTADPDEIADLLRTERPHLVLLDLVLPGADGIEIMQTVPELSDVPVIFISGYGRDETVARAFEVGAADYIVKPFSSTELTARVGAQLRRRPGPAPFVLGDLAIDYGERAVTVTGRAVPLTPTEYELLRILSVNAGRVVTTEALLRQAWGTRKPGGDSGRVRAFVKQVRDKLGDDAANPRYVFNQRGVGYRMPMPDEP
ncbi:MAG: response regulator [Gammaproteobacteria bacterium]|nr:response regulator [Gammaproteobacteria bacterium]